MTRTRLSIALLVLFAPAIALAHGGGGGSNGNGNGGVGGGMGMGNGGVGVGSINGIGHGVGGVGNGVGNGVGGSANGNAGASANMPERDVDAGPTSDTAAGRLAQAREDARERAAARLAKANSMNAHGVAVSTEAHLAKSENDGDKVGEDVRAVARDKSTLKTHTRTHTRVANTHTSTRTHPVNHGAAVSAEAHLAKTENDGDTVGEDVSAVARDKSTLKTHTRTTTKVASTNTSTRTHPVNHGAAVSAEAHLAKSENDGDTVGEDVSAVARDKSTLPTHTTTHTKVATKTTTKTHPVNHGATVSAEAHLAKSENDGDTVGGDVSAVAKTK
jgi:hypothetical protein